MLHVVWCLLRFGNLLTFFIAFIIHTFFHFSNLRSHCSEPHPQMYSTHTSLPHSIPPLLPHSYPSPLPHSHLSLLTSLLSSPCTSLLPLSPPSLLSLPAHLTSRKSSSSTLLLTRHSAVCLPSTGFSLRTIISASQMAARLCTVAREAWSSS